MAVMTLDTTDLENGEGFLEELDVGAFFEEWLWKKFSQKSITTSLGRTKCSLSTNIDSNAKIHFNGTTEGRLGFLRIVVCSTFVRGTGFLGVQGKHKCSRSVNVGEDSSLCGTIQNNNTNIDARNQVG
jgi:hypothetical protein